MQNSAQITERSVFQIPVDEMFEVIFPTFSQPKDRALAVVLTTLYLDESHGTDLPRDVYAVAGFLGNQGDWLDAMCRWEKLLNDYHVAYFRSSDCETLVGEFAQFRDNPDDEVSPLSAREKAKRTEIKKSFVDVIANAGVIGFGTAIYIPDLLFMFERDAECASIFGGQHPYLICAGFTMTAAGYCITRANHEHGSKLILSFVLDQNDELSGQFKPFYSEIAVRQPYCMEYVGSYTFASKLQYKPLQAADLLVYETRKVLFNSIYNPTLATRKALQRLNRGVQCLYRLDRPALEVIAEQIITKRPLDAIVKEKLIAQGKDANPDELRDFLRLCVEDAD